MHTEFDLQADVKNTTTQKRILVVDDEERLHTLIQSYLKQEGFDIVSAQDGREALYMARQQKPDLIILDLMMPEQDGHTFLRHYRRESKTPVIVLTAKSAQEDDDKVLALDLGADDYMTKPFSMRELTARIHAVLRRAGQVPPAPVIFQAADIIVDRGSRLVSVSGRRVDLTPSEFDLLTALITYPGRTFTRTELLDRVQRITDDGNERIIDTHISNLRTKIEPDPRRPRYVESVIGVGYRFTVGRV